ncbi:DNA polymerase III subunit alpha [Anaeroselena agilis]|uniref:DNA polymerase III subunit alpha n=1 Tax=Anaeroselena agilis TaxID=3063788 RepID=A0ABU3NXK6_9FIRM|nr:DNA polymerase III subunit alpha [Selenomonadales bacterium 4137-cl]
MNVNHHSHTTFSLMDATLLPEAFAKRLKELGQDTMCVTDHGTMSGVWECYKAAKKEELKFVPGVELYFAEHASVKTDEYWHILFLAKDAEGYKKLMALETQAHEHFYRKPRIDWSMIEGKDMSGIICTTACIGGLLRRADAEECLLRLKAVFGDDLYVELHIFQTDEQREHNHRILALAQKHGVKIIPAVDAHYLNQEDAAIHRLWKGIDQDSDYFPTDDFFLHSEQQVIEKLAYLDINIIREAIANQDIMLAGCNVEMEEGGRHYPAYPTEDARRTVEDIVFAGSVTEEERLRLIHELNILEKVDFLNYFLIVYDFINWCRRNDIRVGKGRGSVGGSMVAYKMGLTGLNPMKYGLMFERFAHDQRVAAPDIDTDIPQSKRGEVISYIESRYGSVYHVRTFNYLGDKGALQRAGQALKIPPAYIDKLSKQITSLDDLLPNDPAIPNYKELVRVAKAFVGLIQNYGVHASAILVFPENPTRWTPIERQIDSQTREERFVCAYDFEDLEARGLLKLDVLGLRTLDVIDNAVKESYDPELNIDELPDTDPATFDLLCKGQTAGVFQLESEGMTEVVEDIEPRCFEDLIPLVALYRPGPKESGMLAEFIRRRKGGWQPAGTSLWAQIEGKVLGETFGVLVYQEQVMEIAKQFFGYTLAEADMLRRAIGKKKASEMERIINDLIEKGGQYPPKEVKFVVDAISKFADYGFNKCLSGDEKIYRDQNGKFSPTISEMFRIKNDKEYAEQTGHLALHKKYKRGGYGYGLSIGEDGRLRQNKIVNITPSGTRPVFSVRTESGKSVVATGNHKFPTPNGEVLLEDLRVGDLLYVHNGCEVSPLRKYNFGIPTHLEKIVSITFCGTKETYDVEMADPYHNFVTGDKIVVCNSHAATYAYTSYQTAYLKANYPHEFYMALLNSVIGNQEKTIQYVYDAKQFGIPITTPKMGIAKNTWVILPDGTLMAGFSTIKGVGSGDFTSHKNIAEFIKLNPKLPRDKLTALIKAGVFEESRGECLAYLSYIKDTLPKYEEALEKIAYWEEQKDGKRKENMLSDWKKKAALYSTTPSEPIEIDDTEAEMEVLGFSNKDILDNYELHGSNGVTSIAGVVMKVKKHKTKKGKPMMFVDIRGRSGKRSLVFFNQGEIEEGKVYMFQLGRDNVINTFRRCNKKAGA